MAQEKLNELWKMMKTNRLEINNISETDVFCTICKQLLINAHNSPCGCRFCYDCIKAYLDGKEKNCPGNMLDCKDGLLKIDENIFLDQSMNVKISKIVVKCPEPNCEFRDELRNIENHRRLCDVRSTHCTYANLGCKLANLLNADIKIHMETEVVSHSKLLMEALENVKNELEFIKKDVHEIKRENKDLKVELESLKKVKMENEIIIEKLQTKCGSENTPKDDVVVDLKKIENRFMEEQKENVSKFEYLSVINSDFKLTLDKSSKSLLKLESRICDLEKINEKPYRGEFLWCIKKWREKTELAKVGITPVLYSDSFYSHRNGYKMCLQIWPDGDAVGSHLRIAFCLIKGPFDNNLSWPFKQDVTFDLINQHTDQVHTTYTIKCDDTTNIIAYQKPATDKNDGIGYSKFISLQELSTNLALTSHNKLVIKCMVKVLL